jgi:long-subunit acyl-CoA synthetase (AMP-forming)
LQNKLTKYLKLGNSSAVFCEGYGQTECVAACLTNPYFAPLQQSTGILLPDMQAKIVEPGTQKEVPNGTST